ncbi:MAG TPA: PhoU domain-containing protein [Chthoniobacterales bacterium]|nr:PhoU domain-containing protein [Chthoniobacterales bacterium]
MEHPDQGPGSSKLGAELVPSYVDLIFVARTLERIGDHATNIAEDSFWRDQAADILHTYSPKKECRLSIRAATENES